MSFKIGKGSSIHLGAKFNCASNFEMGVNSTINQYCHLDNRGKIFIKDNVSISPYTKIITADHDISTSNLEGRNRSITINDYCFIGMDSLILGGIALGKGTIVGAKSLVNKSTDEFGVYYGIPATLKTQRDINSTNYHASYIRWFH